MITVKIDPKSIIEAVTQREPTAQTQKEPMAQREPTMAQTQVQNEPAVQPRVPLTTKTVLEASLKDVKQKVEDKWNRLMELLR